MTVRTMLLLAATVGAPGSAGAQAPDYWITTLGRDTVAFERVARTGRRLDGTFVVVAPRVRINDYTVEFAADGRVEGYRLSSRAGVEGPGAAPPQTIAADFGEGAITAVVTRGSRTDTVRVAGATRPVPNALFAWGLFELATRAAVAARTDSAVVEQWGGGARAVTRTAVVRRGDSLAVDFFGSPMMAKVDRSGNLAGVDGNRTTVKVVARKLGRLDLDAVTESFLARERAGQVAGALSTRDTVQSTIHGASLWLDYGRPSKRGRQLFGGVIPYDQVWRTGANAATQFRTDRALEFGATTVPAGMYTLWTLPTTRGVSLVVNKQVGQWGTAYDPSQDLTRIDLDVEKLDALVERFTISVVAEGDRGELRFDWDHTRWVARFRVP